MRLHWYLVYDMRDRQLIESSPGLKRILGQSRVVRAASPAGAARSYLNGKLVVRRTGAARSTAQLIVIPQEGWPIRQYMYDAA